MKGQEISILMLSEVISSAETLRFDSEYYFKKYLLINNLIQERTNLFYTLANIKSLQPDGSAFYPALEPYYHKGNFPFLRVGDIKDYFIDYENCIKVPIDISPFFPTLKQVRPGDIVLTKGGTVGNAGLITKEAFVSRDLIFINSSALSRADYVTLFLYFKSDFAYNQLIRSSSQSVQPHLTLTLVKNIYIFSYSFEFKNLLLTIYDKALEMQLSSKTLFEKALLVVQDKLDAKNLKTDKNFNEVRFLKYASEKRLDAEFWHPQFSIVYDVLKSVEYKKISDLADLKKGVQARSSALYGIPYASIKDCNNYNIKTIEKTNEPAVVIASPNDVVLAITGATIGKIAINNTNEGIAISGDLLRITSKKISPLYLLAILSTAPIQLLCKRFTTGATNGHLSMEDVANFPIPILSNDAQIEIINYLQTSFQLRAESERLLSLAKATVELAIEKGESAAEKYLALQLQNTAP